MMSTGGEPENKMKVFWKVFAFLGMNICGWNAFFSIVTGDLLEASFMLLCTVCHIFVYIDP